MIFKVISGGQTGADRAGLDAARDNHLPTGGTAPKDFWTTAGSAPELAAFGLTELDLSGADGYRKRTKMNVSDSDLTIAVASNFNSSGELLTRNACNAAGKQRISFHFSPSDEVSEWIETEQIKKTIDDVVAFINHRALIQESVTLNVAGNSARTSPRCYMFTYAVCDKIFKRVIEDEKARSSL